MKDVTCNSSSTISLDCGLEGYEVFYNPAEWHHISGGIKIRTLQGTTINNVMSLTVEFCNYQDIGNYICIWKGTKDGLDVLNNSATLQVKGMT